MTSKIKPILCSFHFEMDCDGYEQEKSAKLMVKIMMMNSTIHYHDNGDNDHADDCDDELLVGKSLDLGQA